MRRALLLYNPESGRRRSRRAADVETAAVVFRKAGIEPVVEPTRGPNSAAQQAREAIARGCDGVIVCGGDGSVHEVLSAVAGTPVSLGVIPLGTGNGLAHDLGLPRNPALAAPLLAAASTRLIALPRLEYTHRDGATDSTYCMVGAGVGADAHMVYRLTLAFKKSWGMAAYYAEALRQWLTHDFPLFTAEFRDPTGRLRREQVSQVLAIRITSFAGLLHKLAPGAALVRPDFRLILFKTRSRMSFLRYMMGIWSGRTYSGSEVEIVSSTECRCLPLETENQKLETRIYAEADGELLGAIPVSVTMSQETVNLLVPSTARWKSDML